jgi:CHASE3 domain sensor protein
MPEDPRRILAMSDQELQEWALSGDVGSYVHELGQTAMNMRCSVRMAEASSKMANANRDLVTSTNALVQQTRRLVKATWVLVVVTVLVQIGVAIVSLIRK